MHPQSNPPAPPEVSNPRPPANSSERLNERPARYFSAESIPAARAGALFVLLSAALFGVMPVLAKLAYLEGLNAVTLLTLRFSIAAVGMWVIWAVRRKRGAGVALTPHVLLPLVALGAVGYVGQSFSYFTAVSIISATATGLLLYTYPTLVTILAWIFFREQLTPLKLLALSIATVGALMVLGLASWLLSFGSGASPLGELVPEGVMWALAAAGIYSAYIIAGTRFTAGVDPILSSAVIITSAALVYTLSGFATGSLDGAFSPIGWLWIGLIAVVSTVLAIITFFAGLRVVGPSRASIISTVEPTVTVLTAAAVLGERVTFEQIVGGALILGAVLLLQWNRAGKPGEVPPPTSTKPEQEMRAT